MLLIARLYVLHQKMNIYNNKELESTCRSVRSDRNVYREKLEIIYRVKGPRN